MWTDDDRGNGWGGRRALLLLLLATLCSALPTAAASDDRPLLDRVREILGGAPPEGPPGEMKIFPAVDWTALPGGPGAERRTPTLGLVGSLPDVHGVRVSRSFSGSEGGRWELKWTVMRSPTEAFELLVRHLSTSSMTEDKILSGIEADLIKGYGDRALFRERPGGAELTFLRDNILVRLHGHAAAAARVTALGRLLDDAIVRAAPRSSLDFQGSARPRLLAKPRRVRVGDRIVLRVTGGDSEREPWRARWDPEFPVKGRMPDGTYIWIPRKPGTRDISGHIYDTRGRCGRVSVKVVVREAEEAAPKPAPEPVVTLPAAERVARLRKEFELAADRPGRLKLFPLAILDRVPMLVEDPRLTLEPGRDGPEVSGILEYVRSGSSQLLVRYEVWSSRRKAVDALLAAISDAPVTWKKQLARLRRKRSGHGDIGFQLGDATSRAADFVRDNVRVHVAGTGEYSHTVILVAGVLDDHIRSADQVETLGFPADAAPTLTAPPGPIRSGTELVIRLELPKGHDPRAFALLWKGVGPHPKEVEPGRYRVIPGEEGTLTLEARYMDSFGRVADLRLARPLTR